MDVPMVRGSAVAEMELTTNGGMSLAAANNLAAVTARAARAATGMIHLAAGATLRVAGGWGLPPGFEAIRRAPAQFTLAGWVLANEQPLVVTDLSTDARVPADAPVRSVGGRAYAGFPIRDPDGEIAGVCAVLDYEPRTWSAEELAGVDEAAHACTAFVAEQRARHEADRQRGFLDALLASLRTAVAASDAEGRLVFTNEAMRTLSPVVPPDVRDWAALTPIADQHGRPLPIEQVPLIRALAGERLHDVELTVTAGDRSLVLLTDAEPIVGSDGARLGAVVAVHDITDRRRAERFRQIELGVGAALARVETVAEAGPLVLQALAGPLGWAHAELWLVDPDAGVLTPAAQYTAPDAKVAVDVPAQLRPGAGLAGTAWATGATVWTHDLGRLGSLIGAESVHGRPPRTALAVPVPSGGQVLAVLACFADALEDPADALVVLLSGIAAHVGQFLERRRAEELALALARSKDEYLALVGHELRTPLTSISTYIELMRDLDATAFQTDGSRMIEIMSRNSAALRHIVDELLDLAALDSGHATVAQDPVDLTATVRTAVEAAAQAGVTLDLDLVDDLVIIGDRIRLTQVVTHLLDNAIKHSRPGGHVTVTLARPCPAAVELTIADNGIGIPDDEHQQVFTRFYRSSCTRHQGIPGAGLGLAISRAIVDRHHGSIRLMPQSTPGVRIVVRLPVNVPPR